MCMNVCLSYFNEALRTLETQNLPLSVVPCDMTTDSEHKLKHGSFLGHQETLFCCEGNQALGRLLREVWALPCQRHSKAIQVQFWVTVSEWISLSRRVREDDLQGYFKPQPFWICDSAINLFSTTLSHQLL